MLGIPYTMDIDMWSFGCIIAELYTGFPLFPGENEKEQLSMIMEVIGVPPEKLLKKAKRRKIFFDENGKPNSTVNSRKRKKIRNKKSKRSKRKLNAVKKAIRLRNPNKALFIDFLEVELHHLHLTHPYSIRNALYGIPSSA